MQANQDFYILMTLWPWTFIFCPQMYRKTTIKFNN